MLRKKLNEYDQNCNYHYMLQKSKWNIFVSDIPQCIVVKQPIRDLVQKKVQLRKNEAVKIWKKT